MDFKEINELAEILNKNNLTSIEFEEGNIKIKMEKTVNIVAPTQNVQTLAVESNNLAIEENTLDFNNISEVKSPLVGVFYSSSSPDTPPLVSIGTKVKTGDILCIVEAMKLMNEIVAEQDGEIADICVKNGDIVEFGQTLFKIF